MRKYAKTVVERLLARGPAGRLGRWSKRGRTVVLAYHDIVPRGERPVGQQMLHLRSEAFGRQLDALLETHDVVTLEAALDDDGSLPTGRPRAVITFDDGYRGALTAGLDQIRRRELPATLFVAPGLLDGPAFWWDRYARPETGDLPPGFRERALTELEGRETTIRRAARELDLVEHTLPEWAAPASASELEAACEYERLTVGSHSWTHPNLAVLEPREVDRELSGSLDWLRRHCPRIRPWIAYPYGRVTEALEGPVIRAGYAAGFRVAGGWLPRRRARLPQLQLPRVNVSGGMTIEGFRARMAGFLCR